jgi:haloacid dehalogenase-like hydrolase
MTLLIDGQRWSYNLVMKFRVLALDYDGTIAQDGKLNADVRSAIKEARARGLVVVLATGRILQDLRQVAGDLSFFDAVVAENGAVLSFPSGTSRLIGQPPPQSFVDELRRRGIVISVGQCVVEADANSAPQILSLIRDMELPLLLLFNRGKLTDATIVAPDDGAISRCEAVKNAAGMRSQRFRLSRCHFREPRPHGHDLCPPRQILVCRESYSTRSPHPREKHSVLRT